jgi:hypothetical protein
VITPTTNATTLANAILGSGVTLLGTPTLTGVTNQQGTFTNGASEIGFGSGLVLSSGNVNDIPGPNGNTDTPETRGVGDASGDDISTAWGSQPEAVDHDEAYRDDQEKKNGTQRWRQQRPWFPAVRFHTHPFWQKVMRLNAHGNFCLRKRNISICSFICHRSNQASIR